MRFQEYIADLGDGLFQGSWHCTKPEILECYGIESVVHIGFDPLSYESGITYKKVELDDNPQSANNFVNELPDILAFINQELLHKKVLICCSAGRSRSVAIAMAFLMSKRNITSTEALDYIRERRPVANPNSGFINALSIYKVS